MSTPSSSNMTSTNTITISALLARTITDAHKRTCQYTPEQIADKLRHPQDTSAVHRYKDMGQAELWLETASYLTSVVEKIIEFAKLVPGFMRLVHVDQITLLKTGALELAVLRASRQFDPDTNSVLFGETVLPLDVFFTGDTEERKLVTLIFDVAKALAELKLNETQLALYSAYVLLSQDRPGLLEKQEICRLNAAVLKSLRLELEKTRSIMGNVPVEDSLMVTVSQLREISLLYLESLERLRKKAPHLEFPGLHNELFEVDL